MNLLFTGASGFLGKNILCLLNKRFDISTLGLTDSDDYKINLSENSPVLNERFDIVLHAAGKVHSVSKNAEEEKSFFDVNVQGTKNLCSSLEKAGIPSSFIFISTVAVYGLDFGELIREDQPLNGDTPYAKSKLQAEEYLTIWCSKYDVKLSILRPSLIAGPNPPGNLGAMINGIKTGKYLSISGGKARKSILMVQDIADLVPLVAEKGGTYNVCDSEHPTFRDLEKLIAEQLGKSNPISIPFRIARLMARGGDVFGNHAPFNSLKLDKMTKSLTFSNEKARSELGWKPLNVLENFKIQ
jgi:nucleoside-diphosphate-sugar epimerase